MFILKILFAPVSLALTLFTWLCAGLISCSAFVFKLASALLSVPSRFMRKIVCRLRLSEVNRQ